MSTPYTRRRMPMKYQIEYLPSGRIVLPEDQIQSNEHNPYYCCPECWTLIEGRTTLRSHGSETVHQPFQFIVRFRTGCQAHQHSHCDAHQPRPECTKHVLRHILCM